MEDNTRTFAMTSCCAAACVLIFISMSQRAVKCDATSAQIRIEAIKAGLHQDDRGNWVRPGPR